MKRIAFALVPLMLWGTVFSEEPTSSKASPQMVTAQTESHYPELKELEWLIGSWEDKEEENTILITGKWDKYKNFIIQHFESIANTEKKEEIELQQIIGWDPVKKKVRSWVFDSDGGFGEGVWNKVGDSWHVKMTFTLPDGSKGSATNLYKKNEDQTYSFSSYGREIDGELLPNIKPIKLVKKQ